MTTQVYVSTSAAADLGSLGSDWQYVGTLDQSREGELWKVVQRYLGVRSARKSERVVEGYLDLDPDSDGYRHLLAARPGSPEHGELTGSGARFWLALQWDGPPAKTLFARQQAELAPLARRPPEPHPGLRRPGTPVGLRLTADSSGFFSVS